MNHHNLARRNRQGRGPSASQQQQAGHSRGAVSRGLATGGNRPTIEDFSLSTGLGDEVLAGFDSALSAVQRGIAGAEGAGGGHSANSADDHSVEKDDGAEGIGTGQAEAEPEVARAVGSERGADLGLFLITTYNIANQADYPESPSIQARGLNEPFNEQFLRDVIMQGSGVTKDGRFIQPNWRAGAPSTAATTTFAFVDAIRTASGTRLQDSVSIAVDPAVIPLGTWVYIEGVGRRRADDTGGRIRGAHIDLFRNVRRAEALQGTQRNVRVFRARE